MRTIRHDNPGAWILGRVCRAGGRRAGATRGTRGGASECAAYASLAAGALERWSAGALERWSGGRRAAGGAFLIGQRTADRRAAGTLHAGDAGRLVGGWFRISLSARFRIRALARARFPWVWFGLGCVGLLQASCRPPAPPATCVRMPAPLWPPGRTPDARYQTCQARDATFAGRWAVVRKAVVRVRSAMCDLRHDDCDAAATATRDAHA